MGVFCGAPWAGCGTCDASRDFLIDSSSGIGLTRHGLQAQTVLATARSKDRGTPLMPLGVVIDLYMGYMAGIGPAVNSWNVLPMSAHDLVSHRDRYLLLSDLSCILPKMTA